MSEERFDRIEARLDRLEHGQQAIAVEVRELRAGQADLLVGQDGVRGEVRELRAGQDVLRAGQDVLRAGQDVLRAGQDVLRTGYDGLRTDIRELQVGQLELRHHMGVLHEEVLDRIQALVFDPEPLRREFKAADDALREEIGRRLDPIEAALRIKRRK